MSLSIRELRIGEMISVTADWVGPRKSVFLSVPEVALYFDRVCTVHDALLTTRNDGAGEAEVEELTAQAEALDQRHDDLSRGLYYLLIAAYHFELGRDGGTQTRADAIERASVSLFPEQLRAVQASYQAEAGNAAQLDALATNQLSDLLGAIHIGKEITAVDVAHAIGNVGRALGMVENQRSIATAEAKKEAITPTEIRQRMRGWASVVETILMNMNHATGSSEALDSLLQPLKNAAAKAAARRRESRAVVEDVVDVPTE